MKFSLKPLVAVMCVTPLVITGCGSSNSSGSGTTDKSQTLTVVDGYIQGANVCIDQNQDGLYSADECFAETTNEKGQLVFENGIPEGTIRVQALAGKAIDTDFGEKPLAADLELLSPSGFKVVSPITDFILARVALNTDDKLSKEQKLTAAKTEVVALLNAQLADDAATADRVTFEDLDADFMAEDATLPQLRIKAVAQVLASAELNEDFGKVADKAALQTQLFAMTVEKVKDLDKAALNATRTPVTLTVTDGNATFEVQQPVKLPSLNKASIKAVAEKLSSMQLTAGENTAEVSVVLIESVADMFDNDLAANFSLQQGVDSETGLSVSLSESGQLLLEGRARKAGSQNIRVVATAAEGIDVAANFSVIVSAPDTALISDSEIQKIEQKLADMAYLEGSAFEYVLPSELFIDSLNGSYSVTAGSQMSSWITVTGFDPLTLTFPKISGTPNNPGQAGKIHLVITDRYGATRDIIVDLPATLENNAPELNDEAKTTLENALVPGFNIRQNIAIAVPTNLFEDLNSDTLTVVAGSDMATGIAFENNQLSGTFTRSWNQYIHLVATDGRGGSTEFKYKLAINQAPELTRLATGFLFTPGWLTKQIDDANVVAGGIFDVEAPLADLFEDPEGEALTITLASGSAQSIQLVNGRLRGVWEESDTKVELIATDSKGLSVSLSAKLPAIELVQISALDGYLEKARVTVNGNSLSTNELGQIEVPLDQQVGLYQAEVYSQTINHDHGVLKSSDDLQLFAYHDFRIISPLTSLVNEFANEILTESNANLGEGEEPRYETNQEEQNAAATRLLDLLNQYSSDVVYTRTHLNRNYLAFSDETVYSRLAVIANVLADLQVLPAYTNQFTSWELANSIKVNAVKTVLETIGTASAADLKDKWYKVSLEEGSQQITLADIETRPSINPEKLKQLESDIVAMNLQADSNSVEITTEVLVNAADLFNGDVASISVKNPSTWSNPTGLKLTLDDAGKVLFVSGKPKKAGVTKSQVIATSTNGFAYSTEVEIVASTTVVPTLIDDSVNQLKELIGNTQFTQGRRVDIELEEELFDGASSVAAGDSMVEGLRYTPAREASFLSPASPAKISGNIAVAGSGYKIHLVANSKYRGALDLIIDLPTIEQGNSAPIVNEAARQQLEAFLALPWRQNDTWDYSVADLFSDPDGETLTIRKGTSMVGGINYEDGSLVGQLTQYGANRKVHLQAYDESGAAANLILPISEIQSINVPPVKTAIDLSQLLSENNTVQVGVAIDYPVDPNSLFTDGDGDTFTVVMDPNSVTSSGIRYENGSFKGTWTRPGRNFLTLRATDSFGGTGSFLFAINVLPSADTAPTVDTTVLQELIDGLPESYAKCEPFAIPLPGGLIIDPEFTSSPASTLPTFTFTTGDDNANGVFVTGRFGSGSANTLGQISTNGINLKLGSGQVVQFFAEEEDGLSVEVRIPLPPIVEPAGGLDSDGSCPSSN